MASYPPFGGAPPTFGDGKPTNRGFPGAGGARNFEDSEPEGESTVIDVVRNRSVPLVLLHVLVLAACGADDGRSAVAEPDIVVEVTLVDFSFQGLPNAVEAGSRLTVTNAAASELHELVAFRLPDSEARPVEELATLPPGELIEALGMPTTVLLAAPGGPEISAVGDGVLSEPGRYAVFCFIPTGVDPGEYLAAAAETEEGPPQVAGGPPHFVLGMFAELVVEPKG